MKSKMKIIEKQAKGITLVALVVTIIVLLILSGVAISLSIGEDGIFKRAKDATEVYENSQKNEEESLKNISNYIDEILKKDNEETIFLKDAIEKGIVFQNNTNIKDEYGNNIKIPAGFKVAADSGTDVTKGVVIEDVSAGDSKSKGNQYVWIPVNDKIYINNQKEYKEIVLGRYDFLSNFAGELKQPADNYTDDILIEDNDGYNHHELTSSSLNSVSIDLQDFITKAKNSKGYYIGRFEIGDGDAVVERSFEENTSHIENTPVVQKGKWPYTFINQIDASTLAKEMYQDNDDFQSDLVNSYAWDTAIIFIQTFSGDPDYSQQNRLQTTLTTAGSAHDENNNYDVRCNIYDMGGNAREWSTETSTTEIYPCTNRGGSFNGPTPHTAYRNVNNTLSSTDRVSARSILYL